jgi:flagellar motor protein MotB
MKNGTRPDHLASSFTDLMTSLMVIFVLLFLAFVHNQSGKRETVKDEILAELRKQLASAGLTEQHIKKDETDPNAVVIVVPEGLMNFKLGKSDLSEGGKQFISDRFPPLAQLLHDKFYNDIDSVVVEGHTDRIHRSGASQSEGEAENLRLSQDRSMEVVKQALHVLEVERWRDQRKFFLDRLSASGRGEQNASSDPAMRENPEDRRVIFKIRVRPAITDRATNEIRLAAR